MSLSWEALSVLAFISVSFLGWLVKLTSDITTLRNEIVFLKSQNRDFKDFVAEMKGLKERLIRLEDRLEHLLTRLGEGRK